MNVSLTKKLGHWVKMQVSTGLCRYYRAGIFFALLGWVFHPQFASATCVDPPGDISGDGNANVSDVQCTILAALAALAGKADVPCVYSGLAKDADLNCDCQTVVTDVQIAIGFALGAPLDVALDIDQDQCVDTCQWATQCSCAVNGTSCSIENSICGTSGMCIAGDCIPTGPEGDGNSCNDQKACTMADICGGGVCNGLSYGCEAGTAVCDGVGGCASCDPMLGELNRLQNGGAEAGSAAATGAEIVPVPGWATTATFTVLPWQLGDGWLSYDNLGPADAGKHYFVGGPGEDLSTAIQNTDVSVDAPLIDSGKAYYSVSAYLGGQGLQADSAEVHVSFIDGTGTWISGVGIGPVTPDERVFTSGVVLRSKCGQVPPGTRTVEIRLEIDHDEGFYNDGYADNLRFVLIPLPTGLCFNNNDCDDGIACTSDGCDVFGKCNYTPNNGACDDGLVCTDNVCDPLLGCQFPIVCDDGNVCTDNSCDAVTGGCVFTASGAPCDDADPCTLGDICRVPEAEIVPASPTVGAVYCVPSPFSAPNCNGLDYTNAANLALSSPGGAKSAVTQATYADGTVPIHQPAWLNDGAYGNGSSWIGVGPNNWAKVDLGAPHMIDRIRVGRDRTGAFDDRDPGRIRVLVALDDSVYANGDDVADLTEYAEVFDSLDTGYSGQLIFAQTVEMRFAPVQARFVKMIFDNDGTAIDEIEIMAALADSCLAGNDSPCDDGDPCTEDFCDLGDCTSVDAPNDGDGDTFFGCVDDCNDAVAAIHPGAQEVCNGEDDNCDGILLETELDNDGDGHFLCAGDCNDNDPTVYGGAPELCDGKDNNCDGNILSTEKDTDNDGHFICGDDCNDNNPTVYGGAPELCDGIDNNCDSVVPTPELDLDGDGYLGCINDCNPLDPNVHPGAPEFCDGIDNDCNGGLPVDEQDPDNDGWLLCAGDCGPNDFYAFPGAPNFWSTPFINASGVASWDYNCNGTIEVETTQIGVPCFTFLVVCTPAVEGWNFYAPNCGEVNTWYTGLCEGIPLCASLIYDRAQACH